MATKLDKTLKRGSVTMTGAVGTGQSLVVESQSDCDALADATVTARGFTNFGSIVLGLYDDKGRLMHVGQAGSGFTEASHAEMWERLKKLQTNRNPFANKVVSTRGVHWERDCDWFAAT